MKSAPLIKVTDEELSKIRDLSSMMNQAKQAFGSVEIERIRLQKNYEMLQMEIVKNENDLIAKYGKDAVINTQTGEVTKREVN